MDTNSDRERLYLQCREDLLKRDLSNSENYDRAILSLSSGGLGISLAFIKDVVPLCRATHVTLLVTSWFCFGFSIVTTMISFWASQTAIRRQLFFAEQYYLGKKEEYLKKGNFYIGLTRCLNYVSGVAFIAAVVATVWFVTINLRR